MNLESSPTPSQVPAAALRPGRPVPSHPLVEISGLTKSFGPVRALDGISFTVDEGEILGFLGPNGAGKTTTLRILAGFLPGDRGTVRVAGRDVRRESIEVRRAIGYLPEGVPLYPELRVVEYLRFRARLKGVPRPLRRRAIDRSLEASGTTAVARRVIGTLSRGYRQRVGLADALLNEPRVLILDEPTVGLDPEQQRQFRALLGEVGRTRTVILSTHILSEVELVCTSVVIISRGRIAARDSAGQLRALARGRGACTIAEVSAPVEEALAVLGRLQGVTRVEEEPLPAEVASYRRLRIYSPASQDVREEIFRACRDRGWLLRHLEREVLSLEEAFLEIVGGER